MAMSNLKKQDADGGVVIDSLLRQFQHASSPAWISATHNSSRMYDLLKRIHLTRRALQELDRRNNAILKAAPLAAANLTPSLFDAKPSASLKRFAHHGGPNLSDIRGFPQPASIVMANTCDSSQVLAKMPELLSPIWRKGKAKPGNKNTYESEKSGKTNAYDNNFMEILMDNNIQPPARTPRPTNFDELIGLLEQPHASLLLPAVANHEYDEFVGAAEDANSELLVIAEVLPIIRGERKYPRALNIYCSSWNPLVANSMVVTPQPDYLEGINIKPENRLIREHLREFAVPAADAPILPNLFIEAKAPTGNAKVALRQAVYDGAFGARAMEVIRTVAGNNTFDGKAYTFSATYAAGTLRLYAHFMGEPESVDSSPRYHLTQLGSWALDNSVKTFREGATAFRNLRDKAHQIRNEFADAVTSKLQALDLTTMPITPPGVFSDSARGQLTSHASSMTPSPAPDDNPAQAITDNGKRSSPNDSLLEQDVQQCKRQRKLGKFNPGPRADKKISRANIKSNTKAKAMANKRSPRLCNL